MAAAVEAEAATATVVATAAKVAAATGWGARDSGCSGRGSNRGGSRNSSEDWRQSSWRATALAMAGRGGRRSRRWRQWTWQRRPRRRTQGPSPKVTSGTAAAIDRDGSNRGARGEVGLEVGRLGIVARTLVRRV